MRRFHRTLMGTTAALLTVGLLAGCGDDDGDGGNCDANPAGPGCVAELPAPANLQAAANGADGVTLTWSAVSGATGYVVERTTSAAPADFAGVGTPSATTYAETGLTAGLTYVYRVRATDGTDTSDPSTTVSFTVGAGPGPKEAVLSGSIAASRTLFSDTLYVLQGYVKVASGATLTIQPGTRIVGDTLTPGSSLWILRGARIDAQGTAAAPIVFTSARAEGSRKPGDWGGLIVVGNGIINRSGTLLTEGPAGVGETYSGGSDNDDDSGILRYVRIEFAGYDVTGTGQELNALSSYAVGRGTTYEYIQTLNGLDDSFEFWGGAVDSRYLISYESGDDHFDWSEGHRGRHQYFIGFQSRRLEPAPGTGGTSSDPQGIEADGCPSGEAGCDLGNATEPFSIPVLANFTLIGTGAGAPASSSGDNGIVLRRGTGGYLTHGLVARWLAQGISIRDSVSGAHLTANDSLRVVNMLFAENGANYDADGSGRFATAANFAASNHVESASPAASLLASLAPASLDWTPVGDAAAAIAAPVDIPAGFTAGFFGGTLTPAPHYGAADPAGPKWWEGWTSYAEN